MTEIPDNIKSIVKKIAPAVGEINWKNAKTTLEEYLQTIYGISLEPGISGDSTISDTNTTQVDTISGVTETFERYKINDDGTETNEITDELEKTINGRNAFLKITENKKDLLKDDSDNLIPLTGIQTSPDDNCLFHTFSMALTQSRDTLVGYQFTKDTLIPFPDTINVLGSITQADFQTYLRYCLSARRDKIDISMFNNEYGTDVEIQEFSKQFHIPVITIVIENYNDISNDKQITIQNFTDIVGDDVTLMYPPVIILNYKDYHFELVVYDNFKPLKSIFPEFLNFQLRKLGEEAIATLNGDAYKGLPDKDTIIRFIEGVLAKIPTEE